ncbi:flagellar hook-associated protein FlgL [Desulfosarcina sp.]|uniref:flagellar hook-associated protein FlgL n=1 Tax=Desulfosarcina sp. TaxID=2027861 RepID=UPI003970D452
MRISAKIMADHIKANLAKQSSQLMQTQVKLASGKRINKPSDDPIGIGKVLDYRTTLKTIDQYRDNILDAKTRIQFTETVLGQVSEFIEDAKKLAANPNVEDKTAFAQEIDNIRQQVLGLANSKYGANFLFAGHRSDTAPFDQTPPFAYNGDSGSHRVVVGKGITVPIEADGSRMFIDGGDNLFQVLDDLETALTAVPYDRAAVQNTVDPLTRIADRLQLARSGLATDYIRLERTDDYWKNFGNAVETMRQTVEDADIAQTAVDMQVQQTAYEVLLATAGRVIQPTLLDFLR